MIAPPMIGPVAVPMPPSSAGNCNWIACDSPNAASGSIAI